MNTLNVLAFLLLIFGVVFSFASDTGDFYEEKANGNGQNAPTAGQVIFVASNIPKLTQPTATEAPEAPSKPVATSKPSSNETPSKSKKEEEVKEDTKPRKNPPKKGGKSPSPADNEDETNELPKRLFRPRFRAESSAEALKYSIVPIFISVLLAITLF